MCINVLCVCVWFSSSSSDISVLHGPLTQQFQVRDRDLSLLVTPLPHQPIGVHSWDGVDGDQLQQTRAQAESALRSKKSFDQQKQNRNHCDKCRSL